MLRRQCLAAELLIAIAGDGDTMKIEEWRQKIDAIDAKLLRLLNLRAEFAIETGKLKETQGLSLRDPQREKHILSRMKALNPGPLSGKAIERIYRLVLDEAIHAEEIHCGNETQAKRKRRGKRWKK